MILSIIIPVFNEEKTVKSVLEKISYARLPKNIIREIIVVDDGSKDSSRVEIQNFRIKGIKKIFHDKNSGKGSAIKSALKVVRGDYVIIQDADLEYDPSDLIKILEPIIKDGAKVVYGTRLKNYPFRIWGKNRTVMPMHLIANKFLTILTNVLYGASITDMETGYKLVDVKLIRGINLEADKFDFEPEITAKILKKGIPIFEVPIEANPRTYQEGKKIGWRDGLTAIWTLIKYKFKD